MQRQTRRGIILPLAIAMMFAMLILALALVQQEQSNTTFTFIDEVEGLEDQQAEAGFSTMQAIFQGQAEGNPNLLVSETSMFNAADPFGTFHEPVPAPSPPPPTAVQLHGDFTLAAKPPLQSFFLTPDVGLDFNQVGSSIIPQKYARVIETAQIPNQTTQSGLFLPPSQSYFSLYSANYPYGMIAAGGNLRVRDAFAVSDPTFSGPAIGLPVNLFGNLSVTVANYLNGTAWVNKGFATVTLGRAAGVGGGVAQPQAEPPAFPPPDFKASLDKAIAALPSSPTVSLDVGSLEAALSGVITQIIPETGDGRGLDGTGKLLETDVKITKLSPPSVVATRITRFAGADALDVGGFVPIFGPAPNAGGITDFQAAPGTSTVIPLSLVVRDALIVPDRSILVVQGSLFVNGDLFMGEQSTLSVLGDVEVDSTLILTGPATGGLNTSILAQGSVTIVRGMQHGAPPVFTSGGSLFTENIKPLGAVNAVDSSLANTALSQADAATSGLAALVGSSNAIADAVHDIADPAPGALVVSQNGPDIILAQFPARSSNSAGWLVAEGGDVVLADGITGTGTCTGMVWASGSIFADGTSFHDFPYYSAADVLTSTAPPSSTHVAALRYTRTAWGKLP